MRISVKTLIGSILVVIFFAAYQGGRYFMNNRLQELGLALTLALYFYGALFTAFTDRAIRWAWWFWMAPLFASYVLISSSLAFSINAQVGIAPSLFASREFLIVFLAPALYFLYRLGFSLQQIEKLFVIALVIIIVNYLFFYFAIDLEAAYFSTGYMHYQVTYDEWRGYRLKAPVWALIILTFYGLMRLFQPDSAFNKGGWLLVLGLVFYVWSLLMARAQMAALILAAIIYPILFSRPNRMNLFILVAPLGLMFLIAVSGILVENFMKAEGAEVRAAAYGIAWEEALKHPIFGYGQSSGYSKTYQDIFGGKFFPDDLGLVGLTFKYGFIGLALYVFFHFYVTARLLKANWYYRKHYGAHNPLLWSLFILMTAFTFNLFLIPGLAYMQGLTTASFAIAITACYYEEVGLRPGKTRRSTTADSQSGGP